jgi:starvation-inducible DNA-binding protein
VRALAAELGVECTIDPTITPKMDGDTSILGLRLSEPQLLRVFTDKTLLAASPEEQDMSKKNLATASSMAAPMIDIGIKDRDREKIVQGLSRVLADTYTLYLKTHNFHWNVEGPMFNTLHLMFMDQYTELWTALDAIAERIRALGYPAPGTGSEFVRLTSIEETEGVPDAMDMVRLLVSGHEAVTRTARAAFPAAEKAGDESTCDLLTQRLQIHEKTAWMLCSLLK